MQSIFKRCEKKYLITKDNAAILQMLLRQHMEIDGEYLVQNFYYDTADWEIIRESIEKPLYKEKLRLRFYGQFEADSQGFLELKKKFKGISYKRRIAFPLCELKSRSIREIVSTHNSQISREIGFYLQNRAVYEKIHIAYNRMAFFGVKDRELRLTFDKNILFSLDMNRFDAYDYKIGYPILDQNQMVMEIKTPYAIPLWLSRVLSEMHIFPRSLSKFGACYTGHILKYQGLEEIKNAS